MKNLIKNENVKFRVIQYDKKGDQSSIIILSRVASVNKEIRMKAQ